jgi:hypothetical protein
MHRCTFAVVALLAFGQVGAAAEVRARLLDGQLDVEARTAPLPQVLASIARVTGMKLVYEDDAPRPLVTVRRSGEAPAEALLGILDGLGLSYVVGLTPDGSEVVTLIIAGSEKPTRTSVAPMEFTEAAEEDVPGMLLAPPPSDAPAPVAPPSATPGSNTALPRGMTSGRNPTNHATAPKP